MLLFELLRISFPQLQEKDCKLHLAVSNGAENPIEVFLAGEFEEWQTWQSKRNFERKYVVSLLKLPGENRWLFAGGFFAEGNTYIKDEKCYKYKTTEIKQFSSLAGRLVISFPRTGRQSYLNAENWAQDLVVNELRSEKMVVEEFPGYNKVLLSKKRLELVISQCIESWKGALSNVSGVYLITDKKRVSYTWVAQLAMVEFGSVGQITPTMVMVGTMSYLLY